jgi:hypothetical protein
MTTQVLMSNNMTLSETGNNSSQSSNPASQAVASKLPYQATHQVELLHLQAEIEALLQQLQTLKQQRSADSLSDAAQPVLVAR